MSTQVDYREISDRAALPESPLVSVHMLAYRHEHFLAEAIEGVIAQVCGFPIELIIAEDCSPDGTLAVALDYQRRYPSIIRVLTGDRNVGMMENVTRLVMSTRGQFIAICEGDDYWCDSTKLSRQIEVFRRHPDCGLVFHAARIVDASDNHALGTSRFSLYSRTFSTKEIILGDGGLIPTASILVRRDLATDEPAWQREAPVGDYPLALRAAVMGKVVYIDRIMSAYRTNVPHSWTLRHKPELASRMEYARRIEMMFRGFTAEYSHRFDGAAGEMISKYYSDPLVRLPGMRAEKQLLYREIADKLRASDRLLAWIAVTTGVRLPLMKDLLRKSRTLCRLFAAHVRSERISDDIEPSSRSARNPDEL